MLILIVMMKGLCGKKGPGNQVQSICSNCRKGPSSKGLTGGARCFICRKIH